MTLNVMGRLVFFLCQLFVLVLLCGNGLAQSASIKHSPADVVKRYVELDHKGARLDAMSAETVASYTGWSEEPAWGHVVVTRGFVVAEHYRQWQVIDSLEVVIPVTFQVIGSVYLETAGFVQDVETEEIRFRVKAVENRWKIIEPLVPPHVGHKRMVNFVREALTNETDPAKRDRLGVLQEELRKAK
jgi:hypothetical protein